MDLQLFLLIIVVITALAFDYTNGFHDTANAMATSIASGALKPKAAVTLSAVLNLGGAFLSTAVAGTIAKDLVNGHLVTLQLVFAGLVGGIVWNLLTWLLGIPSSSSHALVGGIVGAMIAAVGGHGVIWTGVVSRVLIPALVSVVLAGLVGAVGTWLVYRLDRGVPSCWIGNARRQAEQKCDHDLRAATFRRRRRLRPNHVRFRNHVRHFRWHRRRPGRVYR